MPTRVSRSASSVPPFGVAETVNSKDWNVSDNPPPQLGQYELIGELGTGGMGTVYKTRHTRLNKFVAVKLLRPGRLNDSQAVDRFEREMRAVGKLDHPNIVTALDAGDVDGTHYLVMELIQGVDLATLARRVGQFPVREACELVRQAAIGLQHVYEHGLVHRDIKPSNLILAVPQSGGAPTVKILDLGLALLDDPLSKGSEELTSTGQIVGTVDYMSPEQVSDSHTVDIRADIYSLGATLYKLLTGQIPVSGIQFGSTMKKLLAVGTYVPPPAVTLRSDCPPALSDLIDRMLSKSAVDRLQIPFAVVEALTPFASGADLAILMPPAASGSNGVSSDGDRATILNSLSSTVLAETSPPGTLQGVVGGIELANHASGKVRRIRRLTLAAVGAFAVLLMALIAVIGGEGRVIVEAPDDLPPNTRLALVINRKHPSVDWNVGAGQNERSVPAGRVDIRLPDAISDQFAIDSPADPLVRRGGMLLFRIVRRRTEDVTLASSTTVGDSRPPDSAAIAFDEERKLAEWVQSKGGSGMVEPVDGSGKISFGVRDSLPTGRFVMREIALTQCRDVLNADLDRLSAASRLERLSLSGTGIDSLAAARITKLSTLQWLNLGETSFRTSGFSSGSVLPILGSLALNPGMIDDQWGFLQYLPRVRRIEVWGEAVPGLEPLTRFPQLRTLQLPFCDSADAAIVQIIQSANPHFRLIVGDGDRARTIGNDPGKSAALRLLSMGVELGGFYLGGRHEPITMDDLSDGRPRNISQITIPKGVTLSAADRALLTCFADTESYFVAVDGVDCDPLAATLADNQLMVTLSLVNGDLTDHGLLRLKSAIGLRALDVRGTRVTQAGIDGFRRLQSDCLLISDFGELRPAYEHNQTSSEAASKRE